MKRITPFKIFRMIVTIILIGMVIGQSFATFPVDKKADFIIVCVMLATSITMAAGCIYMMWDKLISGEE